MEVDQDMTIICLVGDFTSNQSANIAKVMNAMAGKVENVFLSGDITGNPAATPQEKATNNLFGSITGSVTNMVAHLQNNRLTNRPAITETVQGPLNNFHVIINNHNGKNWNSTGGNFSETNVGVYATVDDFKNEIADEMVNISDFDTSESGYWTVRNGMLVFKSAVQFLTIYNA